MTVRSDYYEKRDYKQHLLYRKVVDPITGCWFSPRHNHPGEYPSIRFNGKKYLLTRVVAHLFLGLDLNDPRDIMHKCDNKACWNPEHLEPGTHSKNNADVQFRHPREFCPKGHRLTPDNVVFTYVDNSRRCRTCKGIKV